MVLRLDAMKSASLPASEMFSASVCRSSDSRGDSGHDLLEVRLDVPLEGVDLELVGLADVVGRRDDPRAQVGLRLDDLPHLEASEPLDDQPQAAVGQLEHLVDVGGRADPEQVGLDGFLDRGVALGEDGDELPAANRVVDQADGAFPGHRERHERVREQNRVAQREDGEFGGDRERPLPIRGFIERRGFGFVAHFRGLRRSPGFGPASPGRAGGTGVSGPAAKVEAQLLMSKNSAEDDWRCAIIRSRRWTLSRASSQSRQRTAKGRARKRCWAISSPHSKQLP